MSSKIEMCSYFLGYSITQKTMLSKFFSASSHFFKLGSNHASFKYGIFDATCLLCRKLIPLKATALFSSVFLLFSCTLELPFMMGAHWHLLPEAETTLKGLHAHHPILFCKFRPLCLCRILSNENIPLGAIHSLQIMLLIWNATDHLLPLNIKGTWWDSPN